MTAPALPRCGPTHHHACACREAHFAELEAEVARLRNGLAVAESFVRTADAQMKEARAVLREVEWGDRCAPFRRCPACLSPAHQGHAPGCRLAALLKGGTP